MFLNRIYLLVAKAQEERVRWAARCRGRSLKKDIIGDGGAGLRLQSEMLLDGPQEN